ncbi:signal-transducing adaptor protein 1-like isoform X1 [Corythoichthys intestinalis]|uniref:signal-transducing adaptor protein 1-like isoform X1 n=1 Tax=Corythoichthys intestinalis TaxID=161448 RepID=UPI0025A5B891|nr:signal-transducing adaptor protein 1-like isoform X1 [Corythoichthys intestinalis]
MNKRQNYHEGFLDKRSFKDKTSRKMWTCLCGNVLYFYNDKRETECTWKLDLGTLVSITDDNTVDQKLDVAKLNIQTKDGIYKFAAPNAEARELWKGLIKSVAELSVPTKLNLLPGQMVMLEEVVKKEKERLRNAQQDMPSCFHPVSRMEAELLLEREANRGNLLLRPSSDGNGFALSTREEMKEAIYKHYHVSRTPENGFSIDVDNPVACNSLHEVVKYLLEATAGALTTLDREETYQKNIFCISTDAENGERRVHSANTSVHIPLQGLHPKQALPRVPSEEQEENVYVNDNIPDDSTVELSPEPEPKQPAGKLPNVSKLETIKEAEKSPKAQRPTPERKIPIGKLPKASTADAKPSPGKSQKVSLADTQDTHTGKSPKASSPDVKEPTAKSQTAPTPAPRRCPPSTSPPTVKSSLSRDIRLRHHNTDSHVQASLEELKLKLKKVGKCVE